MTGLFWDGFAGAAGDALPGDVVRTRHSLADAAKRFDWRAVADLLDESPRLVNATRPGGASLFAPLHQAAYSNAPTEVIHDLVARGAWRTLENARGERPVDVAVRCGHTQAAEALEPQPVRDVPHGVLMKIQQHLHAMIRSEEAPLIDRYPLRLPELQPLLEVDGGEIFFQVPGMYGGFVYSLIEEGVAAKMRAVASSRMWGWRSFEITSAGSELVGQGPA